MTRTPRDGDTADRPQTVRIWMHFPDAETFVEEYWPNVSSGGIFVQGESLPVGTRLQFEIMLENQTLLMSGRARVSWVKEYDTERPERPHGMGLRFIDLDPSGERLLHQMVDKRRLNRGSGEIRLHSKTVELEHLADEIEAAMPSPTRSTAQDTGRATETAQSSAARGGSNGVSRLLAQADRQLAELIEGTSIDEARLTQIIQAARGAHEQAHGVASLEALLTEQRVGATLDDADALAALEQLLGTQQPAAVAPLRTKVPPPRVVDLARAVQRAPAPTDEAPAVPTEPAQPQRTDEAAPIESQDTDQNLPSVSEPDPNEAATVEQNAFAAALEGEPIVPSTEDMPGESAMLHENADEQEQAFAESLFAAASAVVRREEGRTPDTDFDLSETGEHEAVVPLPSETDVTLGSVSQTAPRTSALRRPTGPTRVDTRVDDESYEEIELLEDEFIEEVSEITASETLTPIWTGTTKHEADTVAEEMPTMPGLSAAESAQVESSAEPATDEESRSTNKKRRRRKSSAPKTRTGIFRRLLGRDDE